MRDPIGDLLASFIAKACEDGRIGPSRVSLFVAIFKLLEGSNERKAIRIDRRELMAFAKICSATIYHKAMHQLNEFGYVVFQQTNNKWGEKQSVI